MHSDPPAPTVDAAAFQPLRWYHRWFPPRTRLEPLCLDGSRDHDWSEEQVAHEALVHLCRSCLLGWGSYYQGPGLWPLPATTPATTAASSTRDDAT